MSYSADLDPHEAVLSIHQGQEWNAEEALVVPILRSRIDRLGDGDMFAVNCTNGMGNIPSAFELFSFDLPLIRS